MSYTYEYPRPAVTVDAVLYGWKEGKLYLLLIQRKKDPFQGKWAFPGGFMDIDETPEAAVRRELSEETGIQVEDGFVQLGAFGALHRDPRHRTVSIAYTNLLKGELPKVKGADDAADACWFSMDSLPSSFAFDHDHILSSSGEKLAVQLKMARAGSPKAFGLSAEEIRQVLEKLSGDV